MAKLMVMIDLPELEYEELREMMNKHQSKHGINFNTVKSKDGFGRVQVNKNYLKPEQGSEWVFLELIGVRP